MNYSSAAKAALAEAGPGWNIWWAVAFANPAVTVVSLPHGTGPCAPRWNETPPASGDLFFPATPSSATPGTSAGWGVLLLQASATTILFVPVFNGTASLLLNLPVSCFNLNSNQPMPPGIVDSTVAAAAADAVAGSSFLTQFPGPNRTYEVISNNTTTLPNSSWIVEYETPACVNGFEGAFLAVVNALNGTVYRTLEEISPCSYAVTFHETGLVPGTNWVVTINGSMYGAVAPTSVNARLVNGSYSYSITSPRGYRATPSAGNFTVDSASLNLSVAFALIPGNYTVTFAEHGVPNGSALWVAGLFNFSANYSSFGVSNGSASVSFAAENGSYAFTIVVQMNNSWAAVPSSGSVNVTGANVTVNVAFVRAYEVTFAATGLPPGSSWSVTLNGSQVQTGSADVNFTEPNGTYPFTVGVASGLSVSPSSGSVVVQGSAIVVPVTVSLVPGNYTLTFVQHGLPSGSPWVVNLVNSTGTYLFEGSNGENSVGFAVPNNTYTYTVDVGTFGYGPAPDVGVVTVAGANVTVILTFSVGFPVTFSETGLPNGSIWSVTLSGAEQAGNTEIGYTEPNGTYNFTVAPPIGYVAVPTVGSLDVDGSTILEQIHFYSTSTLQSVTFNESGLPTGTEWWVNLTGEPALHSTSATVSTALPNGSYTYTVASANKEYASQGGSVNVTTSAVEVLVVFSPVVYRVTLTASGLPSGTEWWVNGTVVGSYDSTSTSIVFNEPNGTYTYSVATANKEYSAPGGSFDVKGANVSVAVTFSLVTYPVTFTQIGLPSATEWYVNITGEPPLDGTGATITTSLPNGSYTFTVSTGDRLYAPSYTPEFAVNGAAVPVSVTFTLVTYAVTFTESGLPGSTEWWVNITGEAPIETTGSTIVITLPNASYTFSASTSDKLYAPTYTTGFTVDGAAVPVSVTFTLVTYAVTFTASGLPSGTEWWVNGSALGSLDSTTATITVDEPNGTYTYTVATTDKEFAAVGGSVTVSGAAVPKSVEFQPVKYPMTFVETGLPSGTNWSVVLDDVAHYSTGTTIVIAETNATYTFEVASVSGYTVTPSNGSLLVHGQAVSQPVTFSASPKAATFLGLPATEGYAVVAGIAVVIVLAALAALFARRGARSKTEPKSEAPPPPTPPAPP